MPRPDMDKCDKYDFSHPALLDQCQPAPAAPRTDPLDTTAELTARVLALWDELTRIADEHRELVRIPLQQGAIRTALIRAQRDAAHRAIDKCKAIIAETLT